ncbi:MAG: 5-formyltetrahydrofolate cyclo-ligase [Gammaproteobacteria bacterium]|nr:5-formyltetrahydrofolate cyclo-ligase [Gammaproteobacteria bacterium]
MTLSPRQQIRQQVRLLRNQLTSSQQQQSAQQLVEQVAHHPRVATAKNIALYLANDGELNPIELIKHLWQQGKNVYLPVLHPFNKGHLLFLRYQPDTKMVLNKYGISEPKLNVTLVCPVNQLDIIFTPLVAFDSQGNRMGMGGGYYDRTLANWQTNKTPYPIGLAHDCQLVEQLPVQAWDIPLAQIITPNKTFNAQILS